MKLFQIKISKFPLRKHMLYRCKSKTRFLEASSQKELFEFLVLQNHIMLL